MSGSVKGTAPPEALVFGAKLKCQYGSSPSYLIVDPEREKTINGLPQACVTDSEISVNIMPFGHCLNGSSCALMMGLSGDWTNPETQNELFDGKEIITTHSFLVCIKQGGLLIEPEDSGQDGVFAEQILFLMDMSAKYPGLFDVLMDPNSSVYLTDGMREDALNFLQDAIDKYGGKFRRLEITFLFETGNLVSPFLLAAVGNLSVANVSGAAPFVIGMENEITKSGLAADPEYFDAKMLEVLRKNSVWQARKVAEGGFYKWSEENKDWLAFCDQMVTTWAYAVIAWGSSTSYASRQGNSTGINQDIEDARIGQANRGEGVNYEGRYVKLDAAGKWQYFDPVSGKMSGYANFYEPSPITSVPAGRTGSIEQHHLFPQEYIENFKSAGLDIEQYKMPMDRADHRLKPNGLHTGPNNWNRQWKDFFTRYPNADRGQILDQLSKMNKEFGLE